jgi:hypothetical protein
MTPILPHDRIHTLVQIEVTRLLQAQSVTTRIEYALIWWCATLQDGTKKEGCLKLEEEYAMIDALTNSVTVGRIST